TKPRRRLSLALTVVALFIFALAAAWLLRSRAVEQQTSLVAVPLTSYPGGEGFPSFSPDGTQVAFSWDGAKQNNSDIYVKQIGVEPPFRLTSDPAEDFSPAWSPDGRFIAFLRKVSTDKTLIMLVPQRGAQERILDEVNVSAPQPYGPYLSWTPDSKWLVAPLPISGQRVWALHLISTETGERRKLTNPPPEEIGDAAPAVSPDGRMLVFSRFSPDFYNVALWLLRLRKDFIPVGKEEKVQSRFITSVGAAWLPSGKEFVFSAGAATGAGINLSLWRMESRELGKFTLTIAPEALHNVIGTGRLLELAEALGREAAAQISSQLVDQVATAALKQDGLKSGVSAAASFIFDGGDFGTVPPRPHFGVVRIDEAGGGGLLRRGEKPGPGA